MIPASSRFLPAHPALAHTPDPFPPVRARSRNSPSHPFPPTPGCETLNSTAGTTPPLSLGSRQIPPPPENPLSPMPRLPQILPVYLPAIAKHLPDPHQRDAHT